MPRKLYGSPSRSDPTRSRPQPLGDGKQGVSGSSPELGFLKLANARFCLDASQRHRPGEDGRQPNNAQLL
jgi:hypothetical protein